jgi:hypothetical protein
MSRLALVGYLPFEGADGLWSFAANSYSTPSIRFRFATRNGFISSIWDEEFLRKHADGMPPIGFPEQ